MRLLSQSWGKAACICLTYVAGFALGEPRAPERRQDVAPSATDKPSPTSAEDERQNTALSASVTNDGNVSSTTVSITPSSSPTSSAAEPTASRGYNASLFNATLPEDQLPIKPVITPGWSVAGTIMLITGTAYALVGIKTKWLHTYFSAAFLASLSTTTLIVYVMVPPVSNAIQGAYVVAVVCTGAILGGLAIIFKEITECLGGPLGGFCFSMWLLTLQPGGLVQSVGGKIAFIASFTFSGFGLYFLPWMQIRMYALIACISFSGATVTVMGIDCFSRAGLKEFWAYIWALNDKLFPLGAATYPLTRGIRVELAVTVILFLAGIISQLKLWRLIKDRRSKREEELAEGERNLRIEEEAIGRQVEEMTKRERRRWERVYGEGATDSGLGDVDSEKRARTTFSATRTPSPVELDGTSKMSLDPGAHISPAVTAVIETILNKDASDGRITVRVGEDEIPESSTPTDVAPDPMTDMIDEKRESTVTTESKHTSLAKTEFPVFTPPCQLSESKTEEDRSSFATFADSEDGECVSKPQVRDSMTERLANRLSTGSAKLMRNLSQRSTKSKKAVVEGAGGTSREELMEATRSERDDADSLAAVMDDLSSSDNETVGPSTQARTVDLQVGQALGSDAEVKIEEPETTTKQEAILPTSQARRASKDSHKTIEMIPTPPAGLSSTEPLDITQTGSSDDSGKLTQTELLSELDESGGAGHEEPAAGADAEEKSVRRASVDSVAASLTKGNLPRPLSRVALSYRTNEWAKHLSAADTPEPEELQVCERLESVTNKLDEEPAPLDVVDLQQTAATATLPPAAPRSASAASMLSNHNGLARSSSGGSLPGYPDPAYGGLQPALTSEQQTRNKTPYRSASMNGMIVRGRNSRMMTEPIAEEGTDGEPTRPVATRFLSDTPWTIPAANSGLPIPPELSASTSVSNLNRSSVPLYNQPATLIGMREALLRSKASGAFNAHPSPEPVYGAAQFGNPLSRRSSDDADSSHNYPSPISQPSPTLDLDDLPMSQRKMLIRQSSMNSVVNYPALTSSKSRASLFAPSSPPPADLAAFDSHQPMRHSVAPSEAIRQAQLANFRHSVQADLRNKNSSPTPGLVRQLSFGAEKNGNNFHGLDLQPGVSPSTSSLRNAFAGPDRGVVGGENVSRNLERQRSMMPTQKEAEAQRLDKERMQREFEERMRSGRMISAHQDAIRRLQREKRETGKLQKILYPEEDEAVSAVGPLHPSPTASPTASHPPPPPTSSVTTTGTVNAHQLDASTADTQLPPVVSVAPGRPPRKNSLLRRRGFGSARLDYLGHDPSPFRTRAAAAHQRISAARLWNPSNSTPRAPLTSTATAATTTVRRPRRPSTPPPPPVPLELTVDPAESVNNNSGFGDLPLLTPTSPSYGPDRPSISHRVSLQLERKAGAEQRISLPPSLRHTPSPAEEPEAGPSFIKPAVVRPPTSTSRRLRSRGQSISSRLKVPFGLSLEPATKTRDVKGKGKEKAVPPVMAPPPPEDDRDRFSPDLERGVEMNPRHSTASRISGIGSVISSDDSSILGDPDQPADNGEEWGPQHPCYPHLNPHVPVDSPEYTSTRIIRIRRDWLLEGDLAPTFSNLYPDILDPAGLSEQEFRRVIDKLNSELVPAFSPSNWRNVLDGVLGLATGWLWDDFGFTAVKSRLRNLEKWIEQWNAEVAKAMGAGEPGSNVIPPKIVPLRRTGYMTLDIQIPDPEIAPASPTTPGASRDGPLGIAEPPPAITA
ncbi:hypothetical protein QBC35DRAFT_445978 [Podospora australis]|uniref:Ras modification protein ERF4 n=1 Tax=Podospora australis TaxID=1536484 RepID=A0AAN6X3Z7_9PEZI|nr:hypothetical protein QBC35DRAFT_445978 [Podospora australis]